MEREWAGASDRLRRAYLIPDPPPPLVPPAGLIQSGDMVIHKGYHLILLWELDAREWLECGRPNILPFVPLMRGGEAELRASVQAIVALPDEGQRKELGAYLSIVSGLRYDQGDIHQILGEAFMSIELEDLESSSIYQYIVEKTEARGRKKWDNDDDQSLLARFSPDKIHRTCG